MNELLSAIGLKKLPLIAGFVGALVSLKFIDGIATWSLWQRLSTVACGAAVAGYCAPLTVQVLELSTGAEGAVAFIVGLFGMSAAGAVIKAMPEWVGAIRERIAK